MDEEDVAFFDGMLQNIYNGLYIFTVQLLKNIYKA